MEDIPPPPPLPTSLRLYYTTTQSKKIIYKGTTYFIDLNAKINNQACFLDTNYSDYTEKELKQYIEKLFGQHSFNINPFKTVSNVDYYSFLCFADGGLASLYFSEENMEETIVFDKYLSLPLITQNNVDQTFLTYIYSITFPIPFIKQSVLNENLEAGINTFLAFYNLFINIDLFKDVNKRFMDNTICTMFAGTQGANYFLHKFKKNLQFLTVLPNGTETSLPIQKTTNLDATITFYMNPFDYEQYSYSTLLQTYLYCRVDSKNWIAVYNRYNNKELLRNLIHTKINDQHIQYGPSYDFQQPQKVPIDIDALQIRNRTILLTDIDKFNYITCKAWMNQWDIATEILAEQYPEGLTDQNKILSIWKARIQAIKENIGKENDLISSDTASTLFKSKPFGSKLGGHIIGFYDLELEPKPYDYVWKNDCISYFIPYPYNSSIQLVDIRSPFVESTKVDVIEGVSIYEYYAQDLADTILSNYYNMDKLNFQRERRKNTLQLKQLSPQALYECSHRLETSFVLSDENEKVYCDKDQFNIHTGYNVDYPVLDVGNLYFIKQKEQIEIIYIKNTLNMWESGFVSRDYISNLIIPQYPKTIYNDFVPVQMVYTIYNIGLERECFKKTDYSVLTYTFMTNLDLMNSIYCWCIEYEKAKKHTEELFKIWTKEEKIEGKNDLGIWNRRECQAYNKLKNICKTFNCPEDTGTIVYRSIEANMGKSIINIGCILREIILINHSIQLEIHNDIETYKWVYSPIGITKNRNLCQQKRDLRIDNPCRPCWDQGIALSNHEYIRF
jgi:hypothetical protein